VAFTDRRREHTRAAALLAVACVLTVTACAPNQGPSTEPSSADTPRPAGFPVELQAEIDAAAARSLAHGVTGTVVAISDPERGTFLRAYGTADTAGTPLTPDVHYRIASVTKTFTADAVLRLVDHGKVGLTDPIATYVPDLPNGDVITVRDLLAMRSGVYDFADDQGFFARYTANPALPGWTSDDALAIMRAHAAEFTAPNVATVYDNSNYVLLGYVIEKATGQTAQEHLTALAKEFRLEQTSYPTTDELPAPFVRGYLGNGTSPRPAGGYRDVTVSNPAVGGTAGAMVSTVTDMAEYAAELGSGVGLSPAIAAERQRWTPLTTSGVRLQYGLGVTQLGDWVGHDGSIFGYSNMVFYLPREQATVVVMSNVADEMAVPSQGLWGEIVKLLYPDSLPSWS
jgi:D-alanyl-D-alanine carboxypeptidase